MSLSIRDTVHRSISRSNRSTVLWSILAILVGVAAFVGTAGKTLMIGDTEVRIPGTSEYLIGRFGPTTVLTEAQLEALSPDDLPLYNVTVEGDQMFTSEWVQNNTTTINGIQTSSSTAYFGYLVVGEHILIVRTSEEIDEEVTTYSAVLTVPEEVGKQVYSGFLSDNPEFRNDLLPLMLDPAYSPLPWYLGAGLEALLVLGGLGGLATAISRTNHDNHPIMKRVARFGDSETVISQIDGEVMSGKMEQVEKLQLTRNWVIGKSGNDMHFARIGDIVWAYKHVTQERYGKKYAAYVWDRSGQVMKVEGKEKQVDAMIMAVLQRAPWAIAGYNSDIEKSWNNDRAGFVRTVDDRRKQMTTPQ